MAHDVLRGTAPAAAVAPAESPPNVRGRNRSGRRRAIAFTIIAGSAGGVLLAAASPPYDLHPLAFIGLAPVLLVATSTRRGFLAGLAAGVVWFGFELSWVFSLAWFGWVIVVGWLALVVVVLGGVAGWLHARRVGFWWRLTLLPSTLVVAEWLQGRWPGGFASQAGVTQHNLAFTRAIVAVGGIAIVSWLIVAVNVAVAEGITRLRDPSRPAWGLLGPAVAIVVAAGLFTVGWVARPRKPPVGSLTVGIVQANDQPGVDIPSETMLREHAKVTRTLDGDSYDVILWSESSLGSFDIDAALGDAVADAAGGVPVLANSYVNHPSEALFYNRNVLFDDDGDPVWIYDKRKLVPFGEYVPFREQLRWITVLQEGVPRDGLPGTAVGIFEIDGARIGSLICFETAIAEFTRDTVLAGAEAIVSNINNASYGYSHESEQFLAVARMRAAETHRAIAVSAISGRSATIEPSGRLTQETDLFQQATLDWQMPLQTDRTVYVRFGDWVIFLSAILLASACVAHIAAVRIRPRRHASPTPDGASRPQ